MAPISAEDLPLLGSTGFNREYRIPHFKFSDDTVEAIGVADMKEMVPTRRLLQDRFSIDDLPVKAYIMGRVDIWGPNSHNSGILQGHDVIFFGTSPLERVMGGLDYVRHLPLQHFDAIYELTGKYEPARRDAIRSFQYEGKLVAWSASPLNQV